MDCTQVLNYQTIAEIHPHRYYDYLLLLPVVNLNLRVSLYDGTMRIYVLKHSHDVFHGREGRKWRDVARLEYRRISRDRGSKCLGT